MVQQWGQQCVEVLGFADDLNKLENSVEDTEIAASRIGRKINMDKIKIMELLGEEDINDTGSLSFEKFNEFCYLGAILSKNNDWNREISVRITKAEKVAFALNKFLKLKVLSKKTKARL